MQYEALGKRLVAWYEEHARALPFRTAAEPYAVWVSEIMAQQTRIGAMLPYYAAFMQAFPTVEALAAAPLDAVLMRWAGLGYYARARNLHAAARQVVRLGGFPRTEAALKKLPGVGAYTAAAVASIAFGEYAPAIDGNAVRVLSRLRAETLAPKQARPVARAMMCEPPKFTQALMELGAVVCLPGVPQCGRCPLADACRAHALGAECAFPAKAAKPERPAKALALALVVMDGRLLTRRRTGTPLKNMNEFPTGEPAALLAELAFLHAVPAEVGSYTHVFTHVRWDITCLLLRPAHCPLPQGYALTPADALCALALPRAFTKALAFLPADVLR